MERENEQFSAIVIRRRDYREHDLLVKMLTNTQGPAMFLVRGAKLARSKKAMAVLPFSYGNFVGWLAPKQLCYLVSVQESHQWMAMGDDLDRNAYATYLLDLADHAFDEGVAMGAWYQQIFTALDMMNQGYDPQIMTNVLEVQLLGRFGVAPQWDGCVICGKQTRIMDYSEAYGGLLCFDHLAMDPHRLHLDQRTVAYLRMFAHLNLQKVDQVKVAPLVKRNLRWALDKIYNDQVGLRLKSKDFIDSMASWDQDLGRGQN